VIAYQVSVQGFVLGSTRSDAAGPKSDPIERLATSARATPASGDPIQGKPTSMRQTVDGPSTLPDSAASTDYTNSLSPPDRPVAIGRRDLDSKTIQLLMKRGQELLAVGDLASARLLFQRAADADDAGAALAAGSTYDPVILAQFSISAMRPNVGKARAWYEKAKALGSTEAAKRLRLLARQ
jgi:hypothetical protein